LAWSMDAVLNLMEQVRAQ
jgi:hypothetical protein